MIRLLLCSVLCSWQILHNSISFAQTTDETLPRILPGTPLSESVNLYEISRYPQNWTITKDSDGNLLVGTQGNAMTFDGARWSSRQIPGNSVRTLAPGYENRLYAGGVDEFGYFEKVDGSHIDSLRYVSLRNLVPEGIDNVDRIFNVIVQPDSTVLFNGTYQSFVYKADSLRLISEDIWVFRLFNINNQIVTNDSLGLSIYENGELKLIPGSEEFEYTGIMCVLPVDKDQFLFTVRYRGVFIYDGNTFNEFEGEVSEFAKQHRAYTCKKLPDDSFLLGTTDAGALRFTDTGDILGRYYQGNGLPENLIYDIYTDSDGTVWLSQFNHITKLDLGIPIRIINETSGFSSLPFSMLYLNDAVYLGTRSGLFRSEIDSKFQFNFEQIFSSNSVVKILETNSDTFFYTTRELYQLRNADESVVSFPSLINMLEASKVNDELIFVASNDGLYAMLGIGDQFTFTDIISNVNLSDAQFVQNSEGDIWIGSASGYLIHLPYSETERFLETGNADVVEYEMPDGWRGDGSRRIALVMVDEEVLIGTPRGLYSIDSETNTVVQDDRFGRWSRLNDQGNPNPIFRMAADREGNVWMRGSRNYQYAERLPDGSYEVHYNILKRIDDDISNEIIPLGDGKAWFLGSKGLVYYDHNLVSRRNVRPPVISRVTVNSDSLVYLGYSREKSQNSQLNLEYQNNDIRFEYGFPDFSSFTGTEYQVMLEGLDSYWSIWSTEAQKDYTKVREGRYQFLVRAKDATGIVSEASVLSIRVFPPWYRTLWAYFLYAGVFSLLLYSIHKYRIDKILEIQKVRNRIASDLHDEVSSTLSSITFFTEAIEKNKEREKSAKYLKLISSSAGEAKEKMSDIIWSIDPEHDNWENLITKCKRYASDLFESKNIQYELTFPAGNRGKIEIELRQNIWLMFKELVTNVARHSEAEFVEVVVKMAGKKLAIEVKDNGKGFDPDSVNKGNGLKNIEKRAEQLNGVASLKSREGQGTEWKVVIRI